MVVFERLQKITEMKLDSMKVSVVKYEIERKTKLVVTLGNYKRNIYANSTKQSISVFLAFIIINYLLTDFSMTKHHNNETSIKIEYPE